ncbi:hypothetical protein B0H17DRAFT_1063719 [Mycena rosella]|uniref:DUF6534 domain-containing protein n=1 Tax=Mycena rosella TaxID=1033263 RepID=A0AAD7DIT1_MYCRO|nr:hypothetical protein B0H17DRAFT_1063719 [Mycena rosella]
MATPTNDNTFGLMYNAVVISAALYGAGCLQAWLYFRKYSQRDPLVIRLLVAAVVVLDTVQQALISQSIYVYLVTGHLDPLIFGKVVNTFIIEIFPSAAIALLVQQFYSYRIYRLSNNNWLLAGFVSAVSVTAFVTLTLYGAQALKIPDIPGLLTLKPLAVALNSIAAGTDLLISFVMVILLSRQKKGPKKTTDMVNRLIIFTFNAGLPTSVCALGCAISVNASPETLIYIFWFLLVGRLYTNCLLVSLNSRDYIRNTASDGVISFNMQNIRVQTSQTTSVDPPQIISTKQSDNYRLDDEVVGYLSDGRSKSSATQV